MTHSAADTLHREAWIMIFIDYTLMVQSVKGNDCTPSRHFTRTSSHSRHSFYHYIHIRNSRQNSACMTFHEGRIFQVRTFLIFAHPVNPLFTILDRPPLNMFTFYIFQVSTMRMTSYRCYTMYLNIQKSPDITKFGMPSKYFPKSSYYYL